MDLYGSALDEHCDAKDEHRQEKQRKCPETLGDGDAMIVTVLRGKGNDENSPAKYRNRLDITRRATEMI